MNKIEVYQGEDLVVKLQGNENLNLDDCYDFTIAFSRTGCCKIVKKEDCKQLEKGIYKCVIPAEDTAGMPTGLYDIEVEIEDERAKIAVAKNAMLIKKSIFGYDKCGKKCSAN
jgi:hypothetical protein